MIKPTTPQEIEDIITQIDTSKSTGPNSIPNFLIKSIKTSISMPLTILFNKSSTSGRFPDALKLTKVIPIYKKDSKLSVVNYRPISLLSNINKIIEKLMFNRLYSFLETCHCIYDLQFGFRQNHFTNHALLNMIQQIREIIDNGNIAVGIFVDFQKAFDTVNHEILLQKLKHYGIRGIANAWFKSYLEKRKQYVTINGTDSQTNDIDHGVPQGSVLGPLLFLVYINDLNSCIKFSTTRHFADDTNLLYTINRSKTRNRNPTRNLNKDLNSLNHWLLANKISLNATKTEMIYFRGRRTQLPTLKVKLNGIKLNPEDEVKYVGLILDEYLTFKSHIKLLNAKLKRANNLIAISRHYLPKNLLIQVYYGQFYSHITYGCQIWGQNENSISKTIALQNKAVSLILFSQSNSYSSLYKELKLLKLKDIIKLNNILFTHATLNKNTPGIFSNYFSLNQTTHKHNTINSITSTYSNPTGTLKIPIFNTRSGDLSLKYVCSKLWNTILRELSLKFPKEYSSNPFWLISSLTATLKNTLKRHFLEHY